MSVVGEKKTIPTLVLMVLLATAVDAKAFNVLQIVPPCYQSHYDGDCIDKQLAAECYLRPILACFVVNKLGINP